MENEPSLLDVADEEFAKINKPEQNQEQGSILDIADNEFKQQEEESIKKEFDVAKLEKLKAEGKRLSEAQERMIFDEKDKVPLLEQAAIGLEKFIPAAAVKVGELSRGAYELAREGIVKPVYVGTKYHLGLATPKETNIAARGAEIAGRSAVSGVMSDLEDTAGTIIKGYESGSAFTDKLQGLSADERFKRYRWRETFSGYEQARREETPDRAAAVLSENVLLQKAAGIAAKMQGGTEEDAKEAEKAYSELVLESGLTREELNPYISAIGEVVSPISIPGANIATKGIGKYTGKAVQKGGELALKGVVKPIATGVEKVAELTEKGITGVQTGARKLGEYVTGDPDTLIRGGSIAGLISAPQITGTILAAKPAAIATKEIARTFKDIASAVDVGGAAGRRGLVERGGAKPNAGALTKRLFSAESRGGLGRARAADWMIRQGNAITQQGVNGAVLNTILGLPDIESIEQGFEAAGSGFGIGAFTGSRIMERAGAVIDPRTGLAQKIDTIITPDPSSRRADEDADIKRFLSSVDPDLVPKMEKLGSIDERKKAIQSKVDALEKQKNVTFGPEVELIKKEIIRQKQNIEKLDKATPQTQKEILRQIHLAFADEMDLAKTTGKAAGLNNIQVKILDPSEMEGFFRNSYGATLTDAESVIASLTGKPDLSPQESENLINSRRIVDGFYNEVGSAQSARGLAISEGSDLEGNEVPAFMRKKNLQGATIVINGDLVKQLSNEGFNIRNVVGHEMQHALGRFTEVRDMLAPIRRELFDQNIVNEDGTVNKVTQGIYSDDKLDAYADTYAASMSPSDNGESFKAQFGGDQNKLRAYIKEEILSEIAGRSGNVSGGTRAGLDSIGRQVVDWIEVNTQNGALKKIKETLRKGGIIVDDSGDISTVLGAELTPESLAMIRQYQRQLKNLNQSMVYEEDARKEEVEIPITKILSDRTLQEKFKNSDIFEKEQVATMTAPDGSKQEIPIPPNAGVDPFVGTYRIQGGQLVDESGNPMNLGPNITFGTMPDGTQVEVGTRIARNVDGSPKILSNREIEARSRNRGKVIRNAIDSALSKGALQLEDTGNGNYRGVMSEAQVKAVLALPNTIVSPNLKRQILFVNEILRRKDGTRMYMEYQAAMRGGKSRALAPQIRDEIPIGFQFSKQGNFLITTMSVSRMHDKMNAWLAKKPENLKLWNGDTASFWDDVIKVLDNHSKGERGETGLDPDAAIALEKKNAVNDLFNVWNADTKAANPRRTKLPVQKGKDPIDVIVRARRIDRINQYNESSLKKMPFNYELNTKNYMPAENPLADFQTPEDFANELPSVTAEEIRNAINTGNLDQVESRLREGDDLKPAESLDEKDGNIRIVSMFDNEFMPQESLDFVDVKPQFMPAETERYPTSERGMYSGLQKTIDEKVQGKFASPDQLKAIVTNPQNAKAEELKWSGVLGEIDRLAAENQGKVPKDKVMDYLRNEGAIKFEEVTIGGVDRMTAPRSAERLRQVLISNGYNPAEADSVVQAASRKENAYTGRNGGIIDLVQEVISDYRGLEEEQNGITKYAQYQLPGGTNYREVVMTMPVPKEKASYEVIQKGDLYYPTDIVRNISQSPYPTFDQANAQVDRLNKTGVERTSKESYTSSHFPETPNYVAHMRLNERTDAQGNEGLFVEELQSDRHQAGREKGYKGEVGTVTIEKVGNIGWTAIRKNPDGSSTNLLIDVGGYYPKKESVEAEIKRMGDEGIPDAPFRKDWSIQLFKRALRDAVDADKKWIGWTTGDTQAERYDLSKQVDQIAVHQRTDMLTNEKSRSVFIQLPIGDGSFTLGVNNNAIIDNTDASSRDMLGKNLADVVGKEMAQKIMDAKSGTILKGDDLKIGGEGMKGFYDTILPKEIGKYVGKMGGKVEKSEIGQEITEDDLDMGDLSDATPQELAELEATGKVVGNTVPIWRVDITPEMAGKVRGGQLQFMPEQPTEYEPISARIRPLQGISAPTKVVGAKALSLGEIEPPVRGKAMLPDMELKPDISEKGIQSSDKTGLQFMPAERDQPTKKYAFAYTTSSDRIPLVAELVKAKNWQAIRDLNQATIRHAMSDLPDVKYTMRDLVGAFENEREISVMPEFEINTPEDLAEVRKRMISLGELWQQTEVLEEQVGGGDQSILGTTDTDGYLHIGKYVLTFDKLTPALVEKARQASGIQAMSYDNNSVIFYDTDSNPAKFEERVRNFRTFVTSNGRVLAGSEANIGRVRSYRNPQSPKEGSLYYNEDPVRLFGEGQLPDRLRSPVYRVVSELLGRPLAPPKDGRSSYFVKEDVTPKQVKLQNAIANKQAAVVLNDKKNKDVIKAYDELNAELIKQFDALVAGGMKFTAAADYDAYNGLYPDSASVIRDIRNNNNLVYLKTTPETFGPIQNGKRMDFSFHPILKDSGRTDASGNKMSYNDILRVVHDAIAHGIYSAQFGPVGEESAWNTHIRTIDNPWARWALTMETRAQNSWVNYQDKFLTEKKTGVDRMPLKKGDKGYIAVPARDYAEQKFALIPLKYALTGDAKIDKPVKDLIEEIGEKRADGSPEKDPEWMPSKQEREKIYASIKQPQGTPKDLLKQASDVIGKLTQKDDAENVPVIVEKAWVEKKSKDEDAEDETDDSVEDGEVITTSTAVLKDVVVYSLKGTPIVVRPLPNLLAENVKTKVSKNVLSIAKDKDKYLEYTSRVVTAADKLRKDPEMFTTTSGYLEFMRQSGASGNLLMPPSQIVQLVKNAKEIVQLWQGGYHGKKTAPGTIAAAVDGLDSVNAMRDLFIQDGVNLGPTRMITALHHLWGILSRQLDPYNQEALWMRMVSYAPVMEQIQLSIDGNFKLTADEWKKIVQDARRATKGDYQKAGNNATANANAFHHMLSKHNGKWQELANIYKLSDPVEMTNAFWGLGVGATGIKNKVQRFIGLTFGIHGSVLDRWRFVGLNLPTAMNLTGKVTPETYFNYYGRNKTIPEDPVGIYKSYGTVENGNPVFSTALYAGIDRTIQGVIDNSKEMRDFLGVHATPGGFHWVDWNCVKNEAVGHSSLDLTKEFLKRKGRNGTVEDFLDVVRTSETFTRADQDGRIIDLVMKNGIFQVVEKK